MVVVAARDVVKVRGCVCFLVCDKKMMNFVREKQMCVCVCVCVCLYMFFENGLCERKMIKRSDEGEML